MEYILIDDVKKHIEILKKYIRPVGISEHPMLVDGGIRKVDFNISADGEWVEPGPGGLSFATNMKNFKKVIRSKGRFFEEIVVNAIDDFTPLPPFIKIVGDSPGHASLVIKERVRKVDVIDALEKISRSVEKIGVIKITP